MKDDVFQRARGWHVAVLVLFACALGMWVTPESQAEQRSRARSSQRSESGAAETNVKADSKLQDKLDQILANQRTILQRLDQMMEELKIVKIRATLR